MPLSYHVKQRLLIAGPPKAMDAIVSPVRLNAPERLTNASLHPRKLLFSTTGMLRIDYNTTVVRVFGEEDVETCDALVIVSTALMHHERIVGVCRCCDLLFCPRKCSVGQYV